MMRVLFIEMVDITTPGVSSDVCVFVNFRHRDTAVLLPRLSFLFSSCGLPLPRHFEVTVLFGLFRS
jgi:hypothetical protein